MYRNYGDQQRAAADLIQAVEAAAYTLETLTIDDARRGRDRIEASIFELTKAAQGRTGHTISQVTLKKIEQVP